MKFAVWEMSKLFPQHNFFFSFPILQHLPSVCGGLETAARLCIILSWLILNERNCRAKSMQRMLLRYSHGICFDIVVDDVSIHRRLNWNSIVCDSQRQRITFHRENTDIITLEEFFCRFFAYVFVFYVGEELILYYKEILFPHRLISIDWRRMRRKSVIPHSLVRMNINDFDYCIFVD